MVYRVNEVDTKIVKINKVSKCNELLITILSNFAVLKAKVTCKVLT